MLLQIDAIGPNSLALYNLNKAIEVRYRNKTVP
jgi:hypothetical protein